MTALGLRQETLLSETYLHQGRISRFGERRKRLRIAGCYPARVRWIDRRSGAIRQEAILDNLSSSGLYMRVRHNMAAGQKACVVFYMADARKMAARNTSAATAGQLRVPRVAVRGFVRRVEALDDGSWGVVLVIRQHRFL